MNLDKIVIVLDHPDECRNIGAACRAMANNGITHLRIVGNKADYDKEKIHILAIHAAYIYDNAEFFESIYDATKDCAIAAGTTRRRGKKRKGKLYLPEEFAESADLISGGADKECAAGNEITDNGADNNNNNTTSEKSESIGNSESLDGIGSDGQNANDGKFNETIGKNTNRDTNNDETESGSDGQNANADAINGANDGIKDGATHGANVAVVFGNERTGLTDEQLSECTVGVTIPSCNDFASLNLSHAVQIICYHLFRKKNERIAGYTPLSLERIDKTVKNIADSLQKIGFFSVTGRNDMEHFWRALLSRSALSESEAKYIEKIFSKAAGLAGKNSSKNAIHH